jgi:hypothetical protein
MHSAELAAMNLSQIISARDVITDLFRICLNASTALQNANGDALTPRSSRKARKYVMRFASVTNWSRRGHAIMSFIVSLSRLLKRGAPVMRACGISA